MQLNKQIRLFFILNEMFVSGTNFNNLDSETNSSNHSSHQQTPDYVGSIFKRDRLWCSVAFAVLRLNTKPCNSLY